MDDFLYILKLQLEGRLSDEQITDQMSLAEEYELSSVPTLLYFKDGEIREKSVGFTHKLIIAENIKKL